MDRRHLLIAEKDEEAFQKLRDILRKTYTVACVDSAEKATEYVLKRHTDLVLLGSSLPDDDVKLIIRDCLPGGEIAGMPVVAILASQDEDIVMGDIREGLLDFVMEPIVPAILLARISRALDVNSLYRNMKEEIRRQREQINRLSLQSILTIAQTVDARDRYAKGHSIRVALYSREIAKRLGWGEKEIQDLYYIALLHDIGKIAVEDSVLNKASSLTENEYEKVKQHTAVGGEMVKNTNFIPGVENGIRYHHEHYDGTGYVGIRGDRIPITARVIAVADAFEAMTSDRAFRKRLSREEAVQQLKEGRGTQFDPILVDVFLELLSEGLSIDEKSAEAAFDEEGLYSDTGELLRQVFNETVHEAQTEKERDSLTGFLKRTFFEERVNVYLMQPRSSGTFFMMDFDNFKEINDRYGHAVGDNLILAFAEVLHENSRSKDYVCRIGGDEFAAFFPEMVKKSVIARRAKDIIKYFAQKRDELGCEGCSVSVGIMTKLPEQENMDCSQMYINADKALYYVKNNGKDSFHMYADIPSDYIASAKNVKALDLKQVMRRIAERKYSQGAYSVEYDRFAYIYQFIARNVERSGQQVQIILYTVRTKEDLETQEEKIEDTLMLLETAIVRSLRRGDVTTRVSPTQQIVVLMDANEENGKIVADRILQKYSDLKSDDAHEVDYEITDVSVKEDAKKDDK